MRYLWLAVMFLVAVAGVFGGHFLGLSRDATAILTMIPAFLALFPFAKQFAPKLRFSVWVIADLMGAMVAWLLYRAFP
jgi:uncharacterized membrane protein required for colicin V production